MLSMELVTSGEEASDSTTSTPPPAATSAESHTIGKAADSDDEPALEHFVVDSELVRRLVASGAADAIVAERAGKAVLKRRKHREKMARYRLKRKEAFGDMTTEARLLAAKLQSLLDFHASQSPSYRYRLQENAQHRYHPQVRGRSQQQRTSMDEFVDIVAEKERLCLENLALRQRLGEFHKFHETVIQEIMYQELTDSEQSPRSNKRTDPTQGGGYWVSFLDSEMPIYYVPFTEEECRAIANDTLRKVFALQTYSYAADGGTKHKRNVSRMGTFFGWTVNIAFEWDDAKQVTVARYKFRKTFRNPARTVAELVEREWEVLHTPALCRNLHCVPVLSRVLQSWNDNLSVTTWSRPDPEQSTKTRSLSIYAHSSCQNPQGKECQIVTISAVMLKKPESSRQQPQRVHGDEISDGARAVNESNSCVYMIYTEGQEEGEIDMEYGGQLEIVNEEDGGYLMVEVGGALVRLEQMILPFRVLTSTDD